MTQAEHLDLHQLTRAMSDWADRMASGDRRALLLKLSTATSLAASSADPVARTRHHMRSGLDALAGRWSSVYTFSSTSRSKEFDGDHLVDLEPRDGQLVGQSVLQDSGSNLTLALSLEGGLATGTWTEETSPTGHYRAATFSGVLQLVVDPTAHSMTGMWLGISKRYTIKSGTWRLRRVSAAEGGP